MGMRWTLRTHDTKLIESIERDAKVSPVLAQILALRGITRPQQVASFFDLKMTGLPAPEQLPGINQATQVISQSLRQGQKIVVYGDYDCDGMTATAILYRCLKLLGGNVSYFIPSRLDDGYGLGKDSLQKLFDAGHQLIITVDCGVASVAEVDFIKQQGRQVVITDHHQFGAVLPAADAIVHPGLPGAGYPFSGLAGAGVAFKLAWSLCQHEHGSAKLPPHLRDFLFAAISLAAIGTVADVVPLLDENRIIVHHGLNCLKKFANPGLQQLMKVAKCWDKPTLEAEDIAFSLAPRLNAAGRLGQARLGVELLTCDNEQRGIALAEYIDQLNRDRDTLDRKIFRAANKMVREDFDPDKDSALVLAHPDWHLGVIGIVAGRIAEAYNRPTVIISTDSLGNRAGVGSCRSAAGINIYQALQECQEYLVSFGGHAAAAGLKIDDPQIDSFRAALCDQVSAQLSFDGMVPDLMIDAEALIGNLNLSTMSELNKLGPFGEGNPRPVLCCTGVRLQEPPKPMGDGRHLSMILTQQNSQIRAVAFGKGDWLPELSNTDNLFDFAFKPVLNEYRGFKSVQLQLIDYRVSTLSAHVR